MPSKITGPTDPRVQAFVGEKRNHLTAIRFVGMSNRQQVWLFACACGGTTVTTKDNVLRGHTQSCGCWLEKCRRTNRITHGLSRSPTHIAWKAMIGRCRNPNNERWEYYGGRGIHVCQRWLNFENFLADMGEKPAGTSLDRHPNNDGNYEPGNCRWATVTEQARNRRSNRPITFRGVTMLMCEWAEEIGLAQRTLQRRIYQGWTIERALTQPLRTIL